MKNAEKTGAFQIRASESASPQEILPLDADLLAVAGKWASLPPAVRAGILAMVNATAPDRAVGGDNPRPASG